MSDLATNAAKLACAWMRRSGSSLKARDRLRAVDAAVGNTGMSTEQRILRAAACDLYDILCASSEGRQALRDLGLDACAERKRQGMMVHHTTHLYVDATVLNDYLASLEHFLDLSLEVRKRFLGLGNALAQARCVDVGDGPTTASEVRVLLGPSDGLRELLVACVAGDFDGL